MNPEYAEHEPMKVARVQTTDGSHIEPPPEQSWTPLEKLRWQAGVVLADTGREVRIVTGCYGDSDWLGRHRIRRDIFGLATPDGAMHAAYDFNESWIFLTGFSAGLEPHR